MNTEEYVPGITRRYPVLKYENEGFSETSVEVCTESRILFYLNDVIVGDLSITPMDMEPFAIGYLICEGYIESDREIEKISINLPEIRVKLSDEFNGRLPCSFSKNSSGGSCRELLPEGELTPLPSGLIVRVSDIFKAMKHVDDYSKIWRRTGGMHCSLIVLEDGEIVCGVEDMGRHTTVDKVVGMALLKGVDLSKCFLICSGRLPVDMVAKAFRAKISMMVSNNAAFAGGIEFAEKANMTLAGFVRPPKLTIYTGANRIKLG